MSNLPRVKLSRKLADQVHFANWCQREEFPPLVVAELVQLAHRYKAMKERSCNEADYPYVRLERMSEKVDAKAAELGCEVTYYGFWPTLVLEENGKRREIDLPL